jgi:hypothetical protein
MSSQHNEENGYEHDLDMLILSHQMSVSYHVYPKKAPLALTTYEIKPTNFSLTLNRSKRIHGGSL